MPEYQGIPCSKQAWNLKFKWLQQASNHLVRKQKPIKKEDPNNDKTLESIRNLYILEKKKDIDDIALKDRRNFYRLKKKKDVNDKALRDKNLILLL